MSWAMYVDEDLNEFRISNGVFVIDRGSEAVRRRLYMRLNRQLGEWYLDTSVGINYYSESNGILGGKLPASAILATIRAAILEDPDVLRVLDSSINKNANIVRGYSVTLECEVKTTDWDTEQGSTTLVITA